MTSHVPNISMKINHPLPFLTHLRPSLQTLCLLLCTASLTQAATLTWDASGGPPLNDGSGNWNATGGANWFDGSTYGPWGNSTDTAVFGVGSGAAGTVTVGNVNASGITFNAAGSGAYTLSSGTISLVGSPAPTFTVNAASATISSALTGSIGLGKGGTGSLLLSGNNSYSGTTTISNGELILGHENALGSSALQFGGGTLSSTGALGGTRIVTGATTHLNNASFKVGGSGSNNDRFVFSNSFSPGSNAQLNAGTSTTIAGTVGGSNQLWLSAGILTLNGNNSAFSGGVRLGNSGFGVNSTVILGNSNAIGSAGNIRFDGGLLQYGAGVTVDYSNRIDLVNSSSFAVHTGGNNVTFNTAITPSVTTGQFTKTGQGTLTLNANSQSTFAGGVNVYGGSLVLDYSNLPTGSATNLVANQTLSLRGGKLILKGNTGATSQSFSTGSLDINGAATSNYITLDANGGAGVTLTLNANAFARNTGSHLHFDLTGGGTINYARTGPGTLTYATVKDGADTRFARYTGTNIIQAPTTALTTSANSSTTDFITSGNLAMNSGSHAINSLVMDTTSGAGTLDLSTTDFRSNAFLVSGNNNYSITSSGGGLVFGGSTEVNYLTMGTGTLTLSANTRTAHAISKGGPGTLFLNGAKSYTGGTNLGEGTIAVDNSGSFGTGNIVVGGDSSIRAEANISVANNISIDGRTLNDSKAVNARVLTVNTQANDTTLSGVISGGGGIVKTGTGVLTLSGANTYLGGTTISQGTVAVSANSNLGDSKFTPVNVTGGTLRITGTSLANLDSRPVNWDSFNGGLDIADANHTFTVANNISGSGSLTKSGAGKLVLTGTNTHTGSTTVSAGTLLISSGSMNSTSQINLNGGVMNYSSSIGLSRNVAVNGGNFKYNSSSAYTGTLTLNSGTVSGGGNLGATPLTIGSGVTLAPGNSPGTTSSGTQTWASLGTYQWEINKAAGVKGNDPGWDWANITGNLNITATSGGKFTIDIVGLNLSNTSGVVNGFDNTQNYLWTIASVSGAISGFDTSLFNLSTGNFTNNNSTGTGTFSIEQAGSDINLKFTAIPEPSAWRLVLFGAMTIPFVRRFRRSIAVGN